MKKLFVLKISLGMFLFVLCSGCGNSGTYENSIKEAENGYGV